MESLFQGIGANMGYISIAVCIAIGMIAMATARAMIGRSRERTRRELAAYVAEGSMTADEAERILAAGRDSEGAGGCCGARKAAKRGTSIPADLA